MSHCIRCQGNVRPSRPRWTWEILRHQFTQSHIYRCDKCGWRGWGLGWTDLMSGMGTSAVAVPTDAEAFSEPVLAAAPTGIDDLDFHVLNIPARTGRELR